MMIWINRWKPIIGERVRPHRRTYGSRKMRRSRYQRKPMAIMLARDRAGLYPF